MAEFFPRKIGEALEKSQEKPQDYKFFDSLEKRKELFDYSKAVAEYLRRERISNLILVDRGARPLYIGVREYLYSMYPEEEIPDIFFVNPRGFKSKEELTPNEMKFLNYELQLSGDPEKKVRDQEGIMELINRAEKEGARVVCNSSENEWAIQASLQADDYEYFCVDRRSEIGPPPLVQRESNQALGDSTECP